MDIELKQKLLETLHLDDVHKMEEILMEMLKNEPHNIELWIKLALTELQFPLVDDIRALECIQKIYEIEENNLYATMLEAGIYMHTRYIPDEMLEKLSKLKTHDNRMRAIIYYLMAEADSMAKKISLRKKLLIKSIKLYDKHPYILRNLAMYYENDGKYDKSQKLYKKAIKEVEKVYELDDFYNFLDIEVYIAEFITGTKISSSNYEYLKRHVI